MLGVDIGLTQVSLRAVSLAGTVLQSTSLSHAGDLISAGILAGSEVAKLRALYRTPLHAVGVALNQIVPNDLGAPHHAQSAAAQIMRAFVEASGLGAGVPLLVENNVNCAAVAEHQTGNMSGWPNAAYMQIGIGVGLGFFCDGRLIRGGQGASGELAQVPASWSADKPSPPYAIEKALGSTGIMASVKARWTDGAPPRSVEQVFALGQAGNATAAAIMQDHAIGLARLASAATTILDPSILVIGGGLAQNAGFADIIIAEFERRVSRTKIMRSSLGVHATVEGAHVLARDLALKTILDRHHKALLERPAIWQQA